MLIWLASYPRSGNTFVRVVLKSVFGVDTRSLGGTGDDRVFFSRPGLASAVGHLPSSTWNEGWLDAARRDDALHIVKTHQPPPTDDPAIYIVRDGRSAIVSYAHYLTQIEERPTPVEDVIDGAVYAGDWSAHLAAWRPLERPRTLLLRYERIVANPYELTDELTAFCSLRHGGGAPRSFAALQSLHPHFFRRGDDAANIAEIGPHLARFAARHGAQMRLLGYWAHEAVERAPANA